MSNSNTVTGKSSSLLWLWIVLGVFGAVVLGLLVCGGIGVFFWFWLMSSSPPPAVESPPPTMGFDVPLEPLEIKPPQKFTTKGSSEKTRATEEKKGP